MSSRLVQKASIVTALVVASGALASCSRTAESPSKASVREDVKEVAKATEKTGKDLGRATGELVDKASESGTDAWITTKVKSELTAAGFDPLQVHVDTANHTVTLSGSVASAADAGRAASLAKAVKGVTAVEDHLFVKPAAGR